MKLQLNVIFFSFSLEKEMRSAQLDSASLQEGELPFIPEKNLLWSEKKRICDPVWCIYFQNELYLRLNMPIRQWNWEKNEEIIFFEFLSLSSNDGFNINSKFNKLCAKWHSSMKSKTPNRMLRAVSAVNLPLIRN